MEYVDEGLVAETFEWRQWISYNSIEQIIILRREQFNNIEIFLQLPDLSCQNSLVQSCKGAKEQWSKGSNSMLSNDLQ